MNKQKYICFMRQEWKQVLEENRKESMYDLPKMLIDLWECMPENIRFLTWYTKYKTLPAHTLYGEKYSFSFDIFTASKIEEPLGVCAQ